MPILELEFEVFCANCGAGLCNQTTTKNADYSYSSRRAYINVEPCENCLQDARNDGYDEGHSKGQEDAI